MKVICKLTESGLPALTVYGDHAHLYIQSPGEFVVGDAQGDANLSMAEPARLSCSRKVTRPWMSSLRALFAKDGTLPRSNDMNETMQPDEKAMINVLDPHEQRCRPEGAITARHWLGRKKFQVMNKLAGQTSTPRGAETATNHDRAEADH